MTCAISPQPMTPTLTRPAMRTPVSNSAGTFHRPYMKGLSVSTPQGADGSGQDTGRLRHAGRRGDERVLMLDGDGVGPAACRERADETVPPGLRLAPPDDGEVPRHLIRWLRPPPVEEAVDGETLIREHDIFSMAVPGAIADAIDDVAPIWFDRRLPLRLVDVLEIGQPSAAGEVRRAVGRRAGRAACERNYAVDSQHRRETDRVAEVGVVLFGDCRVGMQRVSPNVEGADAQTARGYLVLPRLSSRGVAQQQRHVAVSRGCVAAGADLEVGDRRGFVHEPVHDLDERAIRKRLGHHTDAWAQAWLIHLDANCVAIASFNAAAHSSTAECAASIQPR